MNKTNTELVNKTIELENELKVAVYNEAKKLSLFFGQLIPVDNLNIDGHDIKYVVVHTDSVCLSYGNGCIDPLGVDCYFNILSALSEKTEKVEEGIMAYNNAKFDNSNDLYDEMCRLLTDYEEEVNNGVCDGIGEDDLYRMLVKIQNNWEYINND